MSIDSQFDRVIKNGMKHTDVKKDLIHCLIFILTQAVFFFSEREHVEHVGWNLKYTGLFVACVSGSQKAR